MNYFWTLSKWCSIQQFIEESALTILASVKAIANTQIEKGLIPSPRFHDALQIPICISAKL